MLRNNWIEDACKLVILPERAVSLPHPLPARGIANGPVAGASDGRSDGVIAAEVPRPMPT